MSCCKILLLLLVALHGIAARPQEAGVAPPVALVAESISGPPVAVVGAQVSAVSAETAPTPRPAEATQSSTSTAPAAAITESTTVAVVVPPASAPAQPVLSSGGEAEAGGAESGGAAPLRRCWSDSNGYDNASWHEEGEQLERGNGWYVCKAGQLETVGCINEKGEKILLNDTYIHEQAMVQCKQSGTGGAQRIPIGCAPEKQPGKVYLAGETWADEERMTWSTCALNDVWPGGCVDLATHKNLRLGETIDRNLSTFECQRYHYDGYRMVPIGCIFNKQHVQIGQFWEEDEFILYCKQQTAFDEKTTRSMPIGTCIDCIHKRQRLFEGEKVFLNEHAAKCAKKIGPTGNAHCVTNNDDYEAPQPQAQAAGAEGAGGGEQRRAVRARD